jgi:transposase-like protein
MIEIREHFCTNEACKCYGLRGSGNIVKAGTYARKSHEGKRQMLKCTVCGRRFSETNSSLFAGIHYSAEAIRGIIISVAEGNSIRKTATKLGLSKDRVNKIMFKADAYAQEMLSGLLRSLYLNETELDKLWLYITRKNVLRKNSYSSRRQVKTQKE